MEISPRPPLLSTLKAVARKQVTGSHSALLNYLLCVLSSVLIQHPGGRSDILAVFLNIHLSH